ncbi:ABC transporter substrate-binding protein [Afifella sp. JA880]|uniref:ABC transporter substrate-binding protein n=1 Tax=Afifella sp. JA880 TaxID=2975280 RepID=UPI0021BB59EB|nr:ABC transporter substrate-binding protein [Afifella sp. JA880]MCT8267121.1 ABC transporter substrate-binding protein [Afifella sp. JA880]
MPGPWLTYCLAAVAVLAVADAPPAAARPQHIVSINLCADQLLMRLADPDQIASLSYFSRDASMSNLAEEARAFPRNRGLAEEVMRYKPDMVFAGRYTKRVTVDLLKRIGVDVVELDVPRSLPDIEAQIRRVGAELGQEARAEALVQEMEARLATEEVPASERPSAIVYEPNGYTVGAGSIINVLISLAGLENLAAEKGLESYSRLPLEKLVALSPDVLVVGDYRDAPAVANEILHHPVLSRMPRPMEIVSVPQRLWMCGGPDIFKAVEVLRQAADKARARQ